MKTVANWVLLGVFAFQSTGLVWFAHMAQCSEPQKAAICRCGRSHAAGDKASWGGVLAAVQRRPASNDTPVPHRHDPQTCGICQLLLTLAATTDIAPSLLAFNEVALDQPAPSDRPAAVAFLSTLDARGPPALAL